MANTSFSVERYSTGNWSFDDEKAFMALAERRENILQARLKPVMEIERKWLADGKSAFGMFLIKHADEIRDALEPYDSLARPAITEKEKS